MNKKIFLNFWQALLIIAGWATTNLIVWTITTVWIYDHNNALLYQSIQVLLMALNFVPYIMYLIKKTKINIWNYFTFPDFNTLIKVIIVSVLLTYVIRIPLDKPVGFFKLLMDSQIRLVGTSFKNQTLYIIVTSQWILFPFCEEILYRGLILRQFLKRYTATKAILLSSVIFSFSHLDVERFVFLFIIGIIFSIFYYKTNSILVSSISHCIFNMAVIFKPIYHDLNIGISIVYVSIFISSIVIVVFLLKKPLKAITLKTIKDNIEREHDRLKL